MRDFKVIIEACKTRGKLDSKKVKKVASLLTRSELRSFILILREERKKELVTIEVPLKENDLGRNSKLIGFLKNKFEGLDIEFVENKELLGGLIVEKDNRILDLSFKGALGKLYEHFRQSN